MKLEFKIVDKLHNIFLNIENIINYIYINYVIFKEL